MYLIYCSPTSDNLLESAHLMGPIEILVAAEQMKYDLNDSQFVAEVVYKVVVTAENSVGVGPPSNAVYYRKLNRSKFLNSQILLCYFFLIYLGAFSC